MKAPLAEFLSGIQELRRYVECIRIEWHLLASVPAGNETDIIRDLRLKIGTGGSKRRFDYNSIIIALYGLIEQYVEGQVKAYVARIGGIVPTYSELPESFRSAHIELSFLLLNRIRQTRYRGTITEEAIVANLHSCLSGANPYRLNLDGFTQHTANFRADVVDATLTRIGIHSVSQRLRHFPPFSDYLDRTWPERDRATISPEEMYFYLDDLAERRNEAAHGSPSELLSNEILGEYIDFAEAYASGLYELLYCESLGYEVPARGVELGNPIAVFNNAIVCIELRNVAVKVGDVLVARTGSTPRPWIAGEILELQVEKCPVRSVDAFPSVKVGARVGFRTKDNHQFVLLPQ